MKKSALVYGVLMIVSLATAADKTWDGGGADDSWMTAANWNNDTLPIDGDRVFLDVSGETILVAAGDSVAPRRIIGPCENALGTVTMTVEGTLTNTSYWYIGREAGGLGVLNVDGGSIYTRDLIVAPGNGYAGTVNVMSGLLEINGGIAGTGAYFGSEPISGVTTTYVGSATINVYGGILDIAVLNGMGSNALINIAGGQMILAGDQTSVISGYGSQITAYNGTGQLLVTTFEEAGSTFTSVTAIPEPATVCLLGLGALTLFRKEKI